MKTKNKKVMVIIITLILGILGVQQTSYAETAPDTTNIILHKLQYTGSNQNGTIPNDGLEKEGIPDGFESYNPTINGDVEFTLVDATDYVNSKGHEVVQDELITLTPADYESWISVNGTVVAVKSVDQNGQVTFNDVDSTLKNDKHRYYIAFETKTPESVKSPAQPVLIQLPMTNSDGNGYLKDVYVYPKNQIGDKPDVEKDVVNSGGEVITGKPSYSIGDEVLYQVAVTVPKDIDDYVLFNYADQGQTGLTYTGSDNQKPTLVGISTDQNIDLITLVENVDYIYTATNNGFNINFIVDGKVSNNVSKTNGGQIIINYSMTLNEEAKIDSEIDNDYVLSWQNSPNGNKEEKPGSTPVYTGGAKFIKEDGKTDKTLAGAEFVVKNSQDQYYQGLVDGKNSWGDKETAKVLKSDSNGEFEISGLENGKYYLEEVKAPDGYALNSKLIEFEVTENSYSTTQIKVKNYKKSLLPQTGSIELVSMFIVGLLLVFFGGLYYKKRLSHK